MTRPLLILLLCSLAGCDSAETQSVACVPCGGLREQVERLEKELDGMMRYRGEQISDLSQRLTTIERGTQGNRAPTPTPECGCCPKASYDSWSALPNLNYDATLAADNPMMSDWSAGR